MPGFVLLALGILLGARCLAATDGYLSPIAIVAGPDGKVLYVAEATAHQVAVLNIASRRVTAVIPVAESPVGLAMSPDGAALYVTSAGPEGLVQVIDVDSAAVTDSIRVGHTPVAAVPAPNGRMLYVCNQFDNSIGVVDLDLKKHVAAISVTREPVAAAITSDGRLLFVANHLPAGAADTDYTASVVSLVDTAAREVVTNIELPDGSTNLRGITISPDGQHAYVTHTLARYQFPTAYLERGWVNTNAMTVIDVPGRRFLNTVLLDDINLGAADPYGVACTLDGRSIVVAHAGTHELSVIDRKGLHDRLLPARSPREFTSDICSTIGRKRFDPSYAASDLPNDLTFLAGIRRRFRLPGIGPRGLAVVDARVYAAEYFTDSVAFVDISPDAQDAPISIPLGQENTLTEARTGEIYFHDASLSFQKWHSCASCHSGGGRASALNWDLLNDGACNPKNTRSLLLAHQTPPAMVTGVRANAETAVRSGISYVQFAAPNERKASAIDAYLKSLRPVPSPRLVNGKLSPSAERGRRIFEKSGCASCHSGPLHTSMGQYDVGTGTDEEDFTSFDTPSLVEVWRTAPYLHDGRAATIEELLTKHNREDEHGRTSNLTDAQFQDLAEFVMSL